MAGHSPIDARGSCLSKNLTALGAAVLIGSASLAACADTAANDRSEGRAMSQQTIEQALQTRKGELLALPGVVGAAQGLCSGQACIKVYVAESTPDLERAIRRILAGYPVVIEATGPIRARPGPQAPR